MLLPRSAITAAVCRRTPGTIRDGNSITRRLPRPQPRRWSSSEPVPNANGATAAPARGVGLVVFGTMVAATFGLGAWQTQRYFLKINKMAEAEALMALPPVQLPSGGAAPKSPDASSDGGGGSGCSHGGRRSDDGMPADLSGRRVTVAGTFDHSREILVGPRGPPAGFKPPGTGRAAPMMSAPTGFYVYTPLRRPDGSWVLVCRGWVPQSDVEAGRRWGRPEGLISVAGVLSEGEKGGSFAPVNDVKSRRLLWAEPAALANAAGLLGQGDGPGACLPPIIDAVIAAEKIENTNAASCAAAYPAPKHAEHVSAFHVTPQTHVLYAATWYSLAAAGVVLTYSRFRGAAVPRRNGAGAAAAAAAAAARGKPAAPSGGGAAAANT